MLLVEAEEEEEEGEEEAELQLQEDENEIPLVQNMKLSLRSFVGLTSNKSFKVEGEINGQKVVVLIISGASGNFLATRLAKELNLKVRKIPTFTIEVGNGQRERGEGVCCGVTLLVQEVTITQNFFLMELGGSEVVLSIDWLASLGKIMADFQELYLQWRADGRDWKIYGDPPLCHSQASWKTTFKMLKDDGEGYYLAPVPEIASVTAAESFP